MLTFKALNLEDINAIYAQESLEKNALNTFAKILAQYYADTQAKLAQNLTSKSTKFSERNLASNELSQFFSALGFETQNEQDSGAERANSAIDLALIKSSQTTKTISQVKTIIEAKLPENLTKNKQMFSPQNVNCKALHEAILYYLREVNDKQNNALESIIITDFTRFFIFGYKEFERLFSKNAKIKEIFTRYKNDTSSFYTKVYDILETLDDEICGICVDLALLGEFSAQNLTPKIKKRLELLCKILHKDFLFGEFKLNNPLSPRFYNELLYILGLSEVDEKGREIKESKGGKILIKPSKESLSGQNTFYNIIASKLATHKKSNDLDFIMQYVILWLNRILFLKLIEANLIAFNNDRNLAFLNKSTLKDYQAISHLFFEILAKKPSERNLDSPLSFLPYLNSSLFEKQPCEEVLEISALDNEAEFVYYATTQVRQDGKAKAGRVNLLSYIFEFLDAFDFGSGENDFLSGESGASEENSANIIEQKELIKTNVLGLVFEKLNGYKEGSFYTPNFITSYMCRTSLEKIVLDKFNEANPKWNAQNLADLCELIRDERERKEDFKKILQGVKICDPAVGSGHFLVSALCEMVRIYHELRLSDELNEYELKIDNDEIIVYVTKDMVFDYKKPSKPNDNNQAIQKCLFALKKSIIESNLYGVDINPNSVEICKLRLWIELLKNSYYLLEGDEGYLENLDSAIHQMQTLPNIDINIKRGNSLISNIALDINKERLESQLKNLLDKDRKLGESSEEYDEIKAILDDLKIKLPRQIEIYKNATNAYKNETNSDLKTTHKVGIQSAKEFIISLFVKTNPAYREFKSTLASYLKTYGYNGIDNARVPSLSQSDLQEVRKKLNDYLIAFNYHKNLGISNEPCGFVEKDFLALVESMNAYETIANEAKSYFEWRFEFPEVLDKNGDFMGFDLVIGNPPYIRIQELDKNAMIKYDKYKSATKNYDIYVLFVEMGLKLIRQNGLLNYIMPHKWLNTDFGIGLRELTKSKASKIIHLGAFQVFKASTYTALQWFDNKSTSLDFVKMPQHIKQESEVTEFFNSLKKESFLQIKHKNLDSSVWNFSDSVTDNIFAKINKFTKVSEIFNNVYSGLATSKDSVFFLSQCKETKGDKIKGYSSELKSFVEIEFALTKPLLMGDSFHRYESLESDSRTIFPYFKEIDSSGKERIKLYELAELKSKFPKGYAYLKKCEKVLRARENGRFDVEKWFQFGRAQGLKGEHIIKLLCPDICNTTQFSIDDSGKFYFTATIYGYILSGTFVDLNYKYLLAILNSKLSWWFLTQTSVVMRGNYYRIKPAYIKEFCIPNISKREQKPFIDLVDKILKFKKQGADTTTLEQEIDDLVYQLYDLDSNEIDIIESKQLCYNTPKHKGQRGHNDTASGS